MYVCRCVCVCLYLSVSLHVYVITYVIESGGERTTADTAA